MAMRRSFRPRRRFTRRRTFRRGGRFARANYDRIVLFDNFNAGILVPQPEGAVNPQNPFTGNSLLGCAPLEVGGCTRKGSEPFCGPTTTCGVSGELEAECVCCTNQINFTLVNNTILQSYFQDSVTVVRMYGDILYRALPATPFNGEYCTMTGAQLRQFNELYSASYGENWNWAIRKHLRSQADSAAGELSPFDAASPAYDYDWTESSPPWLWQRHKMWFPKRERTFQSESFDSVYGICSNTSQATYIVPPWASGDSPGYIVPAASTTCQVVAPAETGACPRYFTGVNTNEPPWHRLRLRLRKHIRMQRDQDLNLICTVRHPAITLAGGWPCIAAAAFPGFDRGGDVSYQFYIRIAAVVRLN